MGWCWVDGHSLWRILLFLYAWSLAACLFGSATVAYLLVKACKESGSRAARMVLVRGVYVVINAVIWGLFFHNRLAANPPVWMLRVGDLLIPALGGLEMLCFALSENVFGRWKVRLCGPSSRRADELRIVQSAGRVQDGALAVGTLDDLVRKERQDPFVGLQLSQVLTDLSAVPFNTDSVPLSSSQASRFRSYNTTQSRVGNAGTGARQSVVQEDV